ncbi:hypothetical protein FBEOM_9442 [Fusarium beomiforme]|uniref:Uncharacterized protein n=1 Tax=Fusarium beomiforme TaxID=44412 RepID=A0A9P5ADB1_9HYPO|nr:hypothetical protein FBEOM_9442 [Fusarium beomiforme]
MPGTPTSRGCDGCRRQKKKTEDARFDIRAFGGKLIPELVAHIGCSPALDSCVNAMVSLYKAHQCQESRVDALTRYGEALTATRSTILDPRETIIMKMEVVSVMFVCHYWVDRKSIEQHRGVISVLFREAVMKKQLEDLNDYMVGLTQLAVLASFLNPRFELGPWFWEACDTIGTPRPVKYHQGSFLSLESGTMAQVSILMRSPKKNLLQLRGIYDVMQFEMPKVRQLLAFATISAAAPYAPPMSVRICSSYRIAYGILLAMTAVIGHTLQIWDIDLTLVGNLHDCVDECIALVEQCESARPYGAIFVPDFLTMVWAATTDGYRNDEMAEYLVDYEKDSVGADFMGQATSIRERLLAMEARETAQDIKNTLDPILENPPEKLASDGRECGPAVSECVIL